MTEEKKEWLVGAPEFKDRSFSRSEVAELMRSGRVRPNDLVLKVGDVWKAAKDYPDLSEGTRPPVPQARQISPPVPGPARRGATTPPAPKVRPVRSATPPPAPAVPEPAPPPMPKIIIRPQPPAQPASPDNDTDLVPRPGVAAESAEEQAAAPPPPARSARSRFGAGRGSKRAASGLPASTTQALESPGFTTEDVGRRLKYMFHPLKLLVCMLMILVAFLTGGLIQLDSGAGSLVVASLVYFAAFGVIHSLAAFLTRCEIEGTHSLDLVVAYGKNGLNVAISALTAVFFLGLLSLGMLIAHDLKEPFAKLLVLVGTSLAFILSSLVFTMTGGLLNAILAVEVCGVGPAFKRLGAIFRAGFKRVLGHASLMVIFSYALFLALFLPILAHGILGLSKSGMEPNSPVILLFFGLGSAFAAAALGTLNVYSYLWLKRSVAESEGESGPPAREEAEASSSSEDTPVDGEQPAPDEYEPAPESEAPLEDSDVAAEAPQEDAPSDEPR